MENAKTTSLFNDNENNPVQIIQEVQTSNTATLNEQLATLYATIDDLKSQLETANKAVIHWNNEAKKWHNEAKKQNNAAKEVCKMLEQAKTDNAELQILKKFAEEWKKPKRKKDIDEKFMLQLKNQGYSNVKIAKALDVSESLIRTRLKALKTGD